MPLTSSTRVLQHEKNLHVFPKINGIYQIFVELKLLAMLDKYVRPPLTLSSDSRPLLLLPLARSESSTENMLVGSKV